MANEDRLFELFDRAMELTGTEQDAFLEHLAESSRETADRIRSLIEQYSRDRQFFEEPLVPRFLKKISRDESSEFLAGHFEPVPSSTTNKAGLLSILLMNGAPG